MTVSRKDIESAKPFQVFRGDAEEPRKGTRHVLIGVSLTSEEISRIGELGYLLTDEEDPEEIQRDDEACQSVQVDDVDACLAYIRGGGAMVYVPDSPDVPEYGRYVAVKGPRGVPK